MKLNATYIPHWTSINSLIMYGIRISTEEIPSDLISNNLKTSAYRNEMSIYAVSAQCTGCPMKCRYIKVLLM